MTDRIAATTSTCSTNFTTDTSTRATLPVLSWKRSRLGKPGPLSLGTSTISTLLFALRALSEVSRIGGRLRERADEPPEEGGL